MERQDRIFAEWEGGAFISSLCDDFQVEFVALVAEFGPPSLVEYRAHGEGWVKGGDHLAKGDDESECVTCKQYYLTELGVEGRCPVCVD